MRDLAVELQHAISKQHGPGRPACSIQWRRQLHPTMLPSKRSKLQQTNRQSYDLVVASYVLTEMRSDAERQQAVDMLWRQTKDVLVLLEPGTPSGSSYVRHARTQVQEYTCSACSDAQGSLSPAPLSYCAIDMLVICVSYEQQLGLQPPHTRSSCLLLVTMQSQPNMHKQLWYGQLCRHTVMSLLSMQWCLPFCLCKHARSCSSMLFHALPCYYRY